MMHTKLCTIGKIKRIKFLIIMDHQKAYLEFMKHFAKRHKKAELHLKLLQYMVDHDLKHPTPSECDLEKYYAAGVLKKADLVGECYYIGLCRNATVAQWDEQNQVFWYIREKLGGRRIESIKHLEDEQDTCWDSFVPLKYIGPDFEL